MKASSRPLPDWLKWVMRVSGLILPFCSLLFASRIWLSISAIKGGFSGPKPLSSQAMQSHLVQLAADVTIVFILVALGIWMFRRSSKKTVTAAEASGAPAVETAPTPIISPKASKQAAAKRWHSYNILQTGPATSRLWQFDSRFALNREQTVAV